MLSTHPAFGQRPPEDYCDTGEWLAAFRARIPAAQVLFVSPLQDTDAARLARSLDAYGYPVTVLSPDPMGLSTPGGRVADLERHVRLYDLRRTGVRVVDWRADDSVEIAPGAPRAGGRDERTAEAGECRDHGRCERPPRGPGCDLAPGGAPVGPRRNRLRGRGAVPALAIAPGVGFGAFVVAIVAGAIGGALVEPVLLGAVCAVLVLDAGCRSITLGVQLGREADALRLEVLHAAASGTVGLSSVGIAYGLAWSLSIALPMFAVLLLCGCVLALLFARRA